MDVVEVTLVRVYAEQCLNCMHMLDLAALGWGCFNQNGYGLGDLGVALFGEIQIGYVR